MIQAAGPKKLAQFLLLVMLGALDGPMVDIGGASCQRPFPAIRSSFDGEVPMMTRLTLGASALVLAFTLSAQPLELVAGVAAQAAAQGAQPPEQAPSNMQDMMKMHEQMMAEMKAAGSRLDALVKDMNAATGDAKVDAIATVVTELVRQQKSMHDRMGQMHQQMMMGGMMMKK